MTNVVPVLKQFFAGIGCDEKRLLPSALSKAGLLLDLDHL